jgi:beta-glucosidase
VLLFVGEKVTDNDSGDNTGGEGHDRDTIALPGQQPALVRAAVASGKQVVVVILSGGSVSVDVVKNASNVAVVYPGFGGETGQDAILDVLFGDAPATGRLPFTVYPESWGAATPMNDMSFQAGQV